MPSISPPELCFLRLLAAHIALYQCTWFVYRASDDSERTDGQRYPRYSGGDYWRWAGGTAHSGDGLWKDS